MNIKLTIFFAALISIVFPNLALSQNKPLACQEDVVAGLDWENGRWVIRRFGEKKFILVQQDNKLTSESAAKALDSSPILITCTNTNPQILCYDTTAAIIYFDPQTLNGTISRNFAGTMNGNKRDSLSISPFSCTKF
jgi:hypothetical protein